MSSIFQSLANMPQPKLPQNQAVAQPQPQSQSQAVAQPQQQTVAQPPVGQQVTPAQSTAGPTKQSLYKNRLQEYTMKAAIPFPVYRTINEGSVHAPMFRSTVEVAGKSYTSSNTFSQRKAAELDVARVALEALPLKIREENTAVVRENSSFIRENTTFCKSILNEYAVKMHVDKPVYKTENSDGLLPSFVSSVAFNGKQFIGDKGRNKKESQQLAARAVILSILDSDACTAISEIIKSKKLLCGAMDKVNSCNAQNDVMPVGLQVVSDGTTSSSGKELRIVALNDNIPRTAIPEPWTGDPSNVLTKHEPLHEFKIPKQDNPVTEPIATPMIFVPPTTEQAVVSSTSGKKRKRKKAKNNAKVYSQVQVAAASSNETSTCLAAQ